MAASRNTPPTLAGRRAPAGLLLAALAAAAPIALHAPAAQAQESAQASKAFDIPAQPLSTALRLYVHQSGIQVAYATADGSGLQAPAVHGTMSAADALNRLLAGSGLIWHFSGTATVTLERAPAVTGDAATLTLQQVNATAQRESPTGPGTGYVAQDSLTGTKSDTPLIETPQAISVVTRKQMSDQNVQSVAQALRYTSGIAPEQRGVNSDGLEYLYSRGFQIEEYLNGLRLPGVAYAGYNITSFDPYMFDRIELLHGPASVLYGQASPGGILALSSKRPTSDAYHEVGIQTGSYGRIQGSADFSGKLNADGTLLGRITADSFDTGTQTHYIRQKRIAIAPSITWRPDQNTSLTLFLNWQSDPDAGFYNFVPAAGTVLPGVHIARSFNPGDPSYDRYSRTTASIGYSFQHRFSEGFQVFQDFRYLHNDQSINTLEPTGLTANGTQLTRAAYFNTGKVDAFTLDNRAQARFSTGAVKHTLTFGLDWQSTEFDHRFYYGSAPNLSISNPVYYQSIPTPTTLLATSTNQSYNQIGAYAQDQLRWKKWVLMAGIRGDFADERSETLTTHAVTYGNDHALTWRAGLVYLFDNGLAPYFSYTTSFQPQLGSTYGGTPFKPTTGQQYEVGMKYQPPGSNSFITAALFNITQQNVTTTDPAHTSFSIQTGEVRSRGFEIEGHAQLTRALSAIASYTYTDLLNTRSTTSSLNQTPVGIPAHMASGWLNYAVLGGWGEGLQLGGGVRYLGPSWGDVPNTFKVPGVTLVDLSVRYKLDKLLPKTPGLEAKVTVSNLFDRDYIASCISTTSCVYGAGRLVLAGVNYHW